MKSLFVAILLCISFTVFSQKTLRIQAEFVNPPGQTVYMETFNKGWFQKKTITLKDNAFDISFETELIEFFKISFNPNTFIVVIAQPGESVLLKVDMTDIFMTLSVEGSPHTALLYGQEKSSNILQLQIDSLVAEYNALPQEAKNAENAAFYQGKIDELNALKNREIVDFLKKNPESPACLFFTEKLDMAQNFTVFEEVAAKLKALYPDNFVVKSFTDRIESEKRTGIGAVVPDIKLPGVHGDSLSLYPLKGKIVIIDFWASWCGPCRKENPHKVATFTKYRDKGLAMFSVSLDNNGDNWKKAINDDKLEWTDHVSELKGWQSVTSRSFGVSSIPANVIIDANGKILAKNLRGKALDDLLDSLLR